MPRPKVVQHTIRGETLKKSVAAIHTSGELSLLERKMANVLLLNAYQHLITRRTHKISVTLLCAMLGYDSNNVGRLKDVLKRLATTLIEFNVMDDGKESWKIMSMLSYGEIEGGICTYRYDEYLAERLYDPEIYATINMAIQRQFDSGYALTLYENCLRYRAVGSTGWWDIERFRNIMGAHAALYDQFRFLSRDVVKKPLQEVNRVADIHIEAEYKRSGRSVTSIRFLVTDTRQPSLFAHEVVDEHSAVREHPTYKRLIEHGIGDRLALFWVLNDEQRARAVIDYVENKDTKQQVTRSTAGYIRKLIEDKADVGPSMYDEKKAAAAAAAEHEAQEDERAKELENLRNDFQRQRTTATIKALSADDRHAYVLQYLNEVAQGKPSSYNLETRTFGEKLEGARFSAWLRKAAAPAFDADAFILWLKTAKQSHPAAPGNTE